VRLHADLTMRAQLALALSRRGRFQPPRERYAACIADCTNVVSLALYRARAVRTARVLQNEAMATVLRSRLLSDEDRRLRRAEMRRKRRRFANPFD
jgi:hypothetical protein